MTSDYEKQTHPKENPPQGEGGGERMIDPSEQQPSEVVGHLIERIAALEAEVARLGQFVCDECTVDGEPSGWIENRVEGRAPCVCVTESEPYQILQAQRDALMEAASFAHQWILTLHHDVVCNGVHAPDGQCEGDHIAGGVEERLRAALDSATGRASKE